VSQPWTSSNLAFPPGTPCRHSLVASRSGSTAGPGARGGSPFRVGGGWAVVARMPGWQPAGCDAAGGHGLAWPVASYGLGRTGETRAGTPAPALCINRGLESRSDRRQDAHGPPSPGRHPRFPCGQSGSAPITDRLVTPFTRLRAQSGPRKLSPLNFSRGSGSIQRLLWLCGLLTCRSRGRA
jgi:hypothetical protein